MDPERLPARASDPATGRPGSAGVTFGLVFSGLSGLVIEGVVADAGMLAVRAATRDGPVACPGCAVGTERVHAYFCRQVADVSVGGRQVQVRVRARRMRCVTFGCPRQTFREQVARSGRALSAAHCAAEFAGRCGGPGACRAGGDPGAGQPGRGVVEADRDPGTDAPALAGPADPAPWARILTDPSLSGGVSRVSGSRAACGRRGSRERGSWGGCVVRGRGGSWARGGSAAGAVRGRARGPRARGSEGARSVGGRGLWVARRLGGGRVVRGGGWFAGGGRGAGGLRVGAVVFAGGRGGSAPATDRRVASGRSARWPRPLRAAARRRRARRAASPARLRVSR